jgi:hypothetical protein
MVGEDVGVKNDEYGPSLGLIAIMGKALNDEKILDALLSANRNESDLYKTVKAEACIALSDCDLKALLKVRTKGGKNIIDLLEIAKRSLEKDPDRPEDKICC